MSWKVCLTHLAAVAVGWACVDRIIGNRDSLWRAGASPVKTKSGERSPGAKSNAGGDGPLARWMGNTPDPALVERLKHESLAEVADAIWNRFFKEGSDGSIVPTGRWRSDDPPELMNLFRDLLLADPKSVREWCFNLTEAKRSRFIALLDRQTLSGVIPDDQLGLWEDMTPRGSWLDIECGRRVGRSGDIAALNDLLENARTHSKEGNAETAVMMAISEWPENQIESLAGKLDVNSPVVLIGLQRLLERLPVGKRTRLIDAIGANGETGPALAHFRVSAGIRGTGMDLEKRIELLKPLYGEDISRSAPQLIANDVNRFFSDDTLQTALQNVRGGGMKADELLCEVTTRLGKLAEGREDLIREMVFQKLAKIAPDAAVTLMEGIPAKTVQDKVLGLGFDPAGFEAAVSILRVREPELPNDLHNRFSGWGHKSFEGLARYGDAYVSWAMAMPRSLERDLVLSAIAIHVEKEDPDWAARLRTQKTYQSGWRPGMK